MENLQSETDNTMEEDKMRHEAEYKWEMEDYEKRMYEEEVRRQVRKGSMAANLAFKAIQNRMNKRDEKFKKELSLWVDEKKINFKGKWLDQLPNLSQLIVQAFLFIDRLESTLSCETRKNGRQSSMKKKDREKRRRSAWGNRDEKCWGTLSKR